MAAPCGKTTNTSATMKNKVVSRVKELVDGFVSDRKNANNLVEVLGLFQEDDESTLLACMRGLQRAFSLVISQREMFTASPPPDSGNVTTELSSEEKVRVWLLDRYTDFRTRLLQLLSHHNGHVQELSLCTLMRLVEAEGKTPLKKLSAKHLPFPTVFFLEVVRHLVSETENHTALIPRFHEYLTFDDVRYFTMKNVHSALKGKEGSKEIPETYISNVFTLVENLNMPPCPPSESDGKLTKLFCPLPAESGITLKLNTYKDHKKLFTSLWLEFLKLPLSNSIYKKVLLALTDKVIPHMTNALLLSDFLTSSYNIGGAISLLALNGLFVLVHSFNLDYPDFYKKLYALFEPNVFHVKYRARFFFLSDLFLTSTHLPGYLVAAFIKRLSRLSLTAPPSGIRLLLPFIYNLVNRHPNCRVLLHRPDGPTDLQGDPYLSEEEDPVKCCALDSSLWEIKSLQQHYYGVVAMEAKKINNPLQSTENDLADLLELSTGDFFNTEVKKKLKTASVTFDPLKGIFGAKDDQFTELWSTQ